MGRLVRRALSAASLGLLSTSCFVVTDLGRFEKAEARAPSNFSDLRVTVRGMTSHVNELFEYRVVDGTNVIQSRGFIVPLGGPGATFYVKGAVPKQNGPFRLDFYSDHDNSGGYFEPRPDVTLDHSWRLPLDESILDDDGTYVVSFDHNTSFSRLDAPAPPTEFGKNLVVHLRGMAAFQGKRVEVRVGDASIERIVALYRVPSLTQPEVDLTVGGMIESGVTYDVEVYTDDGNGGAVQAFHFEQLATDNGLETTFDGTKPGAAVPNPLVPR
jgi:hypothetical protein